MSSNPAHLQRLLSLDAPPGCTVDTGRAFLDQIAGRFSFQSLGSARGIYRRYLELDNLLPDFVDPGVRMASILRNVSVHSAGRPRADDTEYRNTFGSADPAWVICVRRDEEGTRRLAGPNAPVMTVLDTCAESLLYGAIHLDAVAR